MRKKYSLLRKLVGLQHNRARGTHLLEYSLLRKLVGLQQKNTAWYVNLNTVYSENWSVCNSAICIQINWTIQFTQKIGRSATMLVPVSATQKYSLLRKLVGLQLHKLKYLVLSKYSLLRKLVGLQPPELKVPSGLEYSLLRKLVGLQRSPVEIRCIA